MATSGPPGSRWPTSAFGRKADLRVTPAELPLLTQSGHGGPLFGSIHQVGLQGGVRCPGQGTPSARKMTFGKGSRSPNQHDQRRIVTDRPGLALDSCWGAPCATVLINKKQHLSHLGLGNVGWLGVRQPPRPVSPFGLPTDGLVSDLSARTMEPP